MSDASTAADPRPSLAVPGVPRAAPAGPVRPWTATFGHVGQVVEHLEEAMDRMSRQWNLRWAPVMRRRRTIRFQGDVVTVDLAATLSLDGPFRLELLQEAPGSVWERARGHPVHHVCYWVPDTAAEAARLCAAGWRVEATDPGPDEVNGFCYLVGPDGFRVEPKAERTRPTVDRWIAGGSLYVPDGS